MRDRERQTQRHARAHTLTWRFVDDIKRVLSLDLELPNAVPRALQCERSTKKCLTDTLNLIYDTSRRGDDFSH